MRNARRRNGRHAFVRAGRALGRAPITAVTTTTSSSTSSSTAAGRDLEHRALERLDIERFLEQAAPAGRDERCRLRRGSAPGHEYEAGAQLRAYRTDAPEELGAVRPGIIRSHSTTSNIGSSIRCLR